MKVLAPRPGSTAFLLAHDLRLALRDVRASFGALGGRTVAAIVTLVLLVMHVVAWPIASDYGTRSAAAATREAALAGAIPAALFVLLLMVAQTLNGATKLLYGRGDLELLLCAPVPPRRVLFARAVAVACGALASAGLFVLPVADAGALAGHPHLLALYPALLGGALLAASLGLVVALALFRAIGPRRTRLVAQILATLIGAGFVIGVQMRRLLPAMASLDPLGAASPLRPVLLLPVRAAMGDIPALAAWLALSMAAFVAASLVLGPAFAACVNAASGIPAQAESPSSLRRRARGRQQSFRGGPRAALRAKEWRLVSRDPWVVSQILLQILYMSPVAVVLWSGIGDPAVAVAPAVVVVTFQVASSLTWLGLSGEDAPELLLTAPVPAGALRRGKLEAVALMTLGVVGLPIVLLATAAPAVAALVAGLGLLAVTTAVALQLRLGRPGRRSAFAARHRESKITALLEMALSMLFGIATALLALGIGWGLAPLGAVALLLCALALPGLSRRDGTRAARR